MPFPTAFYQLFSKRINYNFFPCYVVNVSLQAYRHSTLKPKHFGPLHDVGSWLFFFISHVKSNRKQLNDYEGMIFNYKQCNMKASDKMDQSPWLLCDSYCLFTPISSFRKVMEALKILFQIQTFFPLLITPIVLNVESGSIVAWSFALSYPNLTQQDNSNDHKYFTLPIFYQQFRIHILSFDIFES